MKLRIKAPHSRPVIVQSIIALLLAVAVALTAVPTHKALAQSNPEAVKKKSKEKAKEKDADPFQSLVRALFQEKTEPVQGYCDIGGTDCDTVCRRGNRTGCWVPDGGAVR
jgi:hypothetical protein